MKRFDFTIIDGRGQPLHEPGFVESDTDLPVAVMEAVNDYLDAYDGHYTLPLRIEVMASTGDGPRRVAAPHEPRFPNVPREPVGHGC